MGGSTPAAAGFSRPALCLLTAIAAAACTSVNATSASFEATQWQVVAINGQPIAATNSYRVGFTDGQIGGRVGCNDFGARYWVQEELLRTGDIESTLIGCPEPVATHEAQAFAVLRQPMRLIWHSGTRLALSNAAGSLELKRVP